MQNNEIDGSPLRPLFWFSLLGFLQRATLLLLLPVYLNYLTPEDLAVLFLVTLTAKFAGAVANLKLDAAMRTFFFDYAGDESGLRNYLAQIFSASLLLIVVFFGVMLVLGPPLFALIFSHDQVAFFPYGAIAIASACSNLGLATFFVYLKNRLQLREFALYQIMLIVGTLGLQVLLVAKFELGVLGALIGALVPSILVLSIVIVRRTTMITMRLHWRTLRPSVIYSLPLVVFAFLYMLEVRLDRYVLERHHDLLTVARYGVLISLLGLLLTLQDALENAIRPFLFSKLGAGPDVAAQATQSYATFYSVVCLFGLSALVFIASNLSLITQSEDILAMRTWLPLGAVAMVPAIYTRYCALFYVYYKKSHLLTAWMAARVIVTLLLLWWLVPRYAIAGALTAMLVSQLLNALAFRSHLARLGIPAIPILRPALQALLFVAAIGFCKLVFFARSPELFGAMQFLLSMVVLYALNRRLLDRGLSTLFGKTRTREFL